MLKITGADDIPENEDVLANDGLSEEDRKLFSNARPKKYEPYPIKAIEDLPTGPGQTRCGYWASALAAAPSNCVR